jgi:hypothetical protein
MDNAARQLAEQRFKADPNKCFQRHLIEASAELNPREKYPKEFLVPDAVREITRAECAAFIEQYEYLGTLGRGSVYYGLFMPNGEMVGANCFCTSGGGIGNICGPEYVTKTANLARGCCVLHAPENAGSYFTSRSIKMAYAKYGWQVYFAYSDPSASENGKLYKILNWCYLGTGLNHSGGHSDWVKGSIKVKSYAIFRNDGKALAKYGYPVGSGLSKWEWLRGDGWTQIVDPDKGKFCWFEGNKREVRAAKAACRYPLNLPYPEK